MSWIDTIWKILETEYYTTDMPLVRSYLLPDGKFLDFQRGDTKNSQPHYSCANWFGNFVYDYLGKSFDEYRRDNEEEREAKEKKYHITWEEMEDLYDKIDNYTSNEISDGWGVVESYYGFPLIEDLGAIRLNGSNENYIVLGTTTPPTSEQYDKLTYWFDDFFLSKPIEVNIGDLEFAKYDPKEVDTDYVIKRIKRYYSCGKLYESTNSISYEKIDTQEDAQRFLKDAKETFKDDASNFTINQAYNGMRKIIVDNKLIGYIGFSEFKGEEGDDFNNALGIGNFMILDKGKGYGTAVIKDVINKYKNKYDLIYCFVDSDNTGAINLYKKLGKVYDEDGPNDNGQYYVTFYDKNKETLTENMQPFLLEKEKTRIRDILDIIKKVEYGFISKIDGKVIKDRDWINDCKELEKYYTVNTDPTITLKNKLGICQDQAILVKYLMNKYHPEDKVYLYGVTKAPKGHCVPCYCHDNKWYYIENSWDNEKGLHGYFDSKEELEKYLKFMYYSNHAEDTPSESKVTIFTYKIPVQENNKNNSTEKYDPPYNAEQIKQNYGIGLYKKLANDPVHKWRMETGIELIHKEPTKKEFDRIWQNWNLMTDEQKKLSDKKSIELFGISNQEHYKKLAGSYFNSLEETLIETGINYKNIANKIHNKVINDEHKYNMEFIGNQNCLLCTWCAELQIRGEDILPRPVFSPNDKIFANDNIGVSLFNGAKKLAFNTIEELISIVEQSNNNTRYYAHLKWAGGYGGHEVLLINNNTQCYILDAQGGYFMPFTAYIKLDGTPETDPNSTEIYRIDNTTINKSSLELNDISNMKMLDIDDLDNSPAFRGISKEDREFLINKLSSEDKSLNEVYPNKGESKEDFISRFMSATKDEYPDQKQRLAVTYSYWNRRKLKESPLDEATRSTLISKSKNADKYADGKGNRWSQKANCNVANTVADYNQIDMDTFWKNDTLSFDVRVEGETNNYFVGVEINNILPKIQEKVKANNNILNPRVIYTALYQALTSQDIKISCECPDYKYRMKYFASQNGFNKGTAETRKSEKTNPEDTKGAGCKHVLSVLNNLEWLQKIASVINNYVNYCKDNMQYNYSKFIFPKIYGMNYDKAVEQSQDEKLKSDIATINLSNALGKVRGRIKPGSNKNPVANKK